jgi:NADH dehydrogenase
MILIVGSTGLLGGMIARQLLEQGHSVRILVRPDSEYAGLVDLGAEPMFGDLKEPGSLDVACRGVDTVITTANSALRGGPDTVETVDRQGNRNLIEAAQPTSVRQFIFISALGANEESPIEFLRAKAETERQLCDSGITYTILQPNVFMDIWIPMLVGGPIQAGQPVTLVGEGLRKHSMISVADVAAFATASVDNQAALDRTIPLGGPTPVSWRDIVGACERQLGHPVEVRHLEPGEALPGLPDVVSHFAAALDSYDSPIEMTQTASAFGVRLTPLEDFVAGMLLPGGRSQLAQATRS